MVITFWLLAPGLWLLAAAACDELHSACLRHELRPNVAHVEGSRVEGCPTFKPSSILASQLQAYELFA